MIVSHKEEKVAIKAEPIVPPLDTTPTTVVLPMDYVLAPAPKKEVKVVKPAPVRAKVAATPKKEKKYVCGPEWIESNYGGHYQRCEWE